MQMNSRSVVAGASLVCLFGSGVFARQQSNREVRTQPTVCTAELAGTVVEDGPEARPIRRVVVTVSLTTASAFRLREPSPPMTTDDSGLRTFPPALTRRLEPRSLDT